MNVHNDDLPLVQRAQALKAEMDAAQLTQEQMAAKLGKDRTWVAKMLSLLAIHPTALENLSQQKLSFRPLLAMKLLKPDQQIQISEEIKNGTLKPEAIERKIKSIAGVWDALTVAGQASPASRAKQNALANTPWVGYIDCQAVQAVLLGNMWYQALENSFQIGAFQFKVAEGTAYSGGKAFYFTDRVSDRILSGPVESIQAVQLSEQTTAEGDTK